MDPIEWPEEGPEVDVWNHLQTGLDLADEELRYLPDGLRALTEAVAKALLDNRRQIVMPAKQRGWVELDARLLSQQWIRYAADLAIATEGIERSTNGFERYTEIKVAVASDELPPKARQYIKEVAHAYIFGFDPSCIALCRAALEQLLKDRLVAAGIYTAPQLKREQPTAGTLLAKAKQAQILSASYDAAKQVIDRGDELMHSHIADEKVLRRLAVDSINNFTKAALELFGGAPTFE